MVLLASVAPAIAAVPRMKSRREKRRLRIKQTSESWILCRLNLACALIPNGQAFFEIGMIRHVAGDGGILPVNRILHGWLTRAHRLHEVIHVVDLVIITAWSGKGFRRLDQRVLAGQRRWVFRAPLLQVVGSQL